MQKACPMYMEVDISLLADSQSSVDTYTFPGALYRRGSAPAFQAFDATETVQKVVLISRI